MSFQKSTSKVSLGLVVLGSGLPVTAQAATLPVEVPALNQDILNTIDTVSDDSVLEIESDSDIPVLSTDPESSVEPGFSHKNSQIGNDATLPISSESTSEAISYADLESNIVVDPEIDTESIFSITEQITTIQNSSQDVPNLLNEQVESSVVESEPSAFQESEDILVAQILPDTTLGDETSVVTSDVLIDGELADQIDGGAVRGTNLFHSFEEFNVDTGQRVYFENSSGINNILTRVTGENISNIDGVLGVNGPANFFIVNPNGVIFGPNAALDVRGAFSVSTTESIPFSDGSEFGAANISQTPMLSVSVPLGVQSGNNSIETSRTDINGDILLQEGSEIIWPSDNTLTFLASQDIRLSNNSKIKSTNGGNINFITESLELISGSQITANTSNLEDSGKINIVANEHITVSGNSSYIESSVNSNASGNSGGVEIITDSLSVIDGGAIITNTLGSGDSGLLHITSRDNINIAGQGSILTSRVRTNAIGNSGGIEIITKDLDVTDGAIIIASTFGSGSSGQLSIDAQSGTVRVARGSGIGNEVRNNVSVGQNQRSSGDLIIMAGSLIVEDNSVINANTLGNGNSGQLKINANELIRVSGSNSRISNGVSTDAIGNSGGIEIITNSLDVLDGAGIIGSTDGIGNSGQINISAEGNIIVQGSNSNVSFITSRVNTAGIGTSSGINIIADNLSLTDDAQIVSATFNKGSAGDIDIYVDGDLEVRGEDSVITSGVATNGIGNSGNLTIQSNTLSLSGGANISADTQGIGNSGFLSVNSREYIELDGTGIATDGGFTSITSNVAESAIGNSGGVHIETANLNLIPAQFV